MKLLLTESNSRHIVIANKGVHTPTRQKGNKELVDYLKCLGFAAPDYLLRDNQMAKYNMRQKSAETIYLVKE